MKDPKMTVGGNLRAMREDEHNAFWGNKIKKAGDSGFGQFVMNKPLLAQTPACVGALPPGANTVGGCVGSLKDVSEYGGVRRRR